MSIPTASNLTDYEYLRSILQSYHQALQEEKSFPPISPDKAMHILAKTLGMKSSHVLKSELNKLATPECPSGTGSSPDLYELEFKDCPVFTDVEPVSAVFRTRGEAVWHLYHHYVAEKMLSDLDNLMSFDFQEKHDEMTAILRRHNLYIRPNLARDIETGTHEALALEALRLTLIEDVYQKWPIDAILELIDLYFSGRDADVDMESWYSIQKVELRDSHQYEHLSQSDCPARLKI